MRETRKETIRKQVEAMLGIKGKVLPSVEEEFGPSFRLSSAEQGEGSLWPSDVQLNTMRDKSLQNLDAQRPLLPSGKGSFKLLIHQELSDPVETSSSHQVAKPGPTLSGVIANHGTARSLSSSGSSQLFQNILKSAHEVHNEDQEEIYTEKLQSFYPSCGKHSKTVS